jgi:hypothetical protein
MAACRRVSFSFSQFHSLQLDPFCHLLEPKACADTMGQPANKRRDCHAWKFAKTEAVACEMKNALPSPRWTKFNGRLRAQGRVGEERSTVHTAIRAAQRQREREQKQRKETREEAAKASERPQERKKVEERQKKKKEKEKKKSVLTPRP